ncbi:MAG: T9SS type A sorting domain-containing protein [Fimbriimonadaceae bacterium]|nr:T9SS type A sorting domain-containing protein [Chitinophagales bacterium]
MKKTLLILLFYPAFLFSQNQANNWFFGDSLMLNFNDGVITAEQLFSENLIMMKEASASISDAEGNLLFYTDGKYVWNKLHQVMENGCCMLIGKYYDLFASGITQGVVILPSPASENNFYIFVIGEENFYYSLVDMTANDGLGAVVEGKKNVELISDTYFFEKMHAVKHANGRDWWLLVHEKLAPIPDDSTNTFFRFLITPEGISDPYIHNAGTKWGDVATSGQMLFSPQGDRLVFPQENYFEVFDFDRCEGLLSNPIKITLEDDNFKSYGLSFSPDGSKVYISSVREDGEILQYCFNCEVPLADTEKLIYFLPGNNYVIGQHQLANDGKIYVSIVYNSGGYHENFSVENMNLCVINNPNEEGLACDFDTSTIWLGGRRVICGLPNFANYSLGALVGSECDTLDVSINNTIHKNEITLYPNPATDHLFINTNNIHYASLIIHITDAAGKNILAQNITSNNTKINITQLSKGIYFVSIKQDAEVVFKESFVKQ